MSTNTFDLTKTENPVVIAAKINEILGDQGLTTRAIGYKKRLTLFVEYKEIPKKDILISLIKNTIVDLKPANISQVIIRGSAVGQTTVAWQESFNLEASDHLGSSEQPEWTKQAATQPTSTVSPRCTSAQQNLGEYRLLNDALARPRLDMLGFGVLTFLLVVHTGFFFDSFWSNAGKASESTSSPCILLK